MGGKCGVLSRSTSLPSSEVPGATLIPSLSPEGCLTVISGSHKLHPCLPSASTAASPSPCALLGLAGLAFLSPPLHSPSAPQSPQSALQPITSLSEQISSCLPTFNSSCSRKLQLPRALGPSPASQEPQLQDSGPESHSPTDPGAPALPCTQGPGS